MRTKSLHVAFWACLACVPVAAQPVAAALPGPLTAIESLDLPRYMGQWFEIARYPNRFQSQCLSDTRAHYQLQAGGGVQVINSCRKSNGDVELAQGEARQQGAADSPRLRVRFAPAWLAWLPQVWGDYWVIDLDPDYQLVAVSEPSRQYLWVLSRTPTVPTARYAALLARLQTQGFEPQRLQHSRQE